MMNWNHRLVNRPSQNGGDPRFELREVHYDIEGLPVGHTAPFLWSETLDGVTQLVGRLVNALAEPVMHEDNFPANPDFDSETGLPIGEDDDAVLGRIDTIEQAIVEIARELRQMKHKVEDDISRAKFEESRAERQMGEAVDKRIEEMFNPAKVWPNWGKDPGGFDGPSGAE